MTYSFLGQLFISWMSWGVTKKETWSKSVVKFVLIKITCMRKTQPSKCFYKCVAKSYNFSYGALCINTYVGNLLIGFTTVANAAVRNLKGRNAWAITVTQVPLYVCVFFHQTHYVGMCEGKLIDHESQRRPNMSEKIHETHLRYQFVQPLLCNWNLKYCSANTWLFVGLGVTSLFFPKILIHVNQE